MATYKNGGYLTKSSSEEFDKFHGPGNIVPYSGIYRCEGCGREIASNQKDPFPPQNHHQHSQNQGAIRWQLIVFADHKPK